MKKQQEVTSFVEMVDPLVLKGGDLTAWMMTVRRKLGDLWGLDRAISHAELGRALRLSDKYGGSHISKLEKAETGLSGPILVAIEAMMSGWRPVHFEEIVKPGYPRSPREARKPRSVT